MVTGVRRTDTFCRRWCLWQHRKVVENSPSLTAARRVGAFHSGGRPARQNTPVPFPKRDSRIDAPLPRPLALQVARRSRPPVGWPMTLPSRNVGQKRGGCPIRDRVPIRGTFAGSHRENLKPGPRGPVNHDDPLFPRLGSDDLKVRRTEFSNFLSVVLVEHLHCCPHIVRDRLEICRSCFYSLRRIGMP
jgi:hypothetical protein